MRRTKDKILQRIIEKIKLSYQNGCKPIIIEDLESQFRDMTQMEGLNRQERYDLIKSKIYPARKKTERFGIPTRRLVRGGYGIRRHIYGLKPVDKNDEIDCKLLEGDLVIDMKKRDGFARALDERAEVAQTAGALTAHQVKRFQLIGGEGKKTKILEKH